MGNTTSYVKIKPTQYAVGFIIKKGSSYTKILIIAGHPDNSYITKKDTDYAEYNTYGEWYEYNGNYNDFEAAITKFNPKTGKVRELMDCLSVHCNIHLYKSTFTIIYESFEKIINIVRSIPETCFRYLLCVPERKQITA